MRCSLTLTSRPGRTSPNMPLIKLDVAVVDKLNRAGVASGSPFVPTKRPDTTPNTAKAVDRILKSTGPGGAPPGIPPAFAYAAASAKANAENTDPESPLSAGRASVWAGRSVISSTKAFPIKAPSGALATPNRDKVCVCGGWGV